MDEEIGNMNSKLGHLTKRVNRMLSEKYRLSDSLSDGQEGEIQIIMQDQVRQAYNQTQKMTIKLKQIRTLLGYEQQPHPKKINYKTASVEGKKDDRGINLKKFVMSMRKRNQTTKPVIIHPGRGACKQIGQSNGQNHSIQQYTDASLKYINSFLPHKNLLQNQLGHHRKLFSQHFKSPGKNQKTKRVQNIKELEQLQKKLFQSPYPNDEIAVKIPNHNYQNKFNHSVYSPIIPKIQMNSHQLQNKSFNLIPAFDSTRRQTLNQYSTIHIDTSHQAYFNNKNHSKRLTSPLDFLAGKATQLISKQKSNIKQLHRSQRKSQRKQKDRLSKAQSKQLTKRIIPVILPCIPKQRV